MIRIKHKDIRECIISSILNIDLISYVLQYIYVPRIFKIYNFA